MSRLEELDGSAYPPLSRDEQQAASGGIIGTGIGKCRIGTRDREDYIDDEIAMV